MICLGGIIEARHVEYLPSSTIRQGSADAERYLGMGSEKIRSVNGSYLYDREKVYKSNVINSNVTKDLTVKLIFPVSSNTTAFGVSRSRTVSGYPSFV